jgi:hypothetical protein
MYEYAKIKVTYKNFTQAPSVIIKVDTITVGGLQSGRFVEKLIPLSSKPLRLRIFREDAPEQLLLDSSFVPAKDNNFTLFITDLLSVAEFYTPPASPVNKDSNRVQLLNNIKVQGVGKTINFKFFTSLNTGNTAFEALAGYELNNVEYGKVSTPIDIPLMKYPAGQTQAASRPVYIKAYDAVTGTLLVDIKTGSSFAAYGRVVPTGSITTNGGKHSIINVNATETAGVVSYVSPFQIYSML